MKVNLLYLNLWIVLITLVAGEALAQLSEGQKETIFIGPVKVSNSLVAAQKGEEAKATINQLADSLQAQLVTEVNQTRVFQVVERERKEDIEMEQAYAQVAVSPSDTEGASLMKMRGAKYAFLPRIDGFEDRTTTTRYDAIQRQDIGRTIVATAVVAIVNTSTGELLPESPSVRVKRSKSANYTRKGVTIGGGELLSEVAQELASKLAQEAVAIMRPARVLMVSDSQLLINRGTEAGFSTGVEVEFYATEDVKDEDSGELYRNEISIGRGLIRRADSKQSFAELKGKGMLISKGALVKIVKRSAVATNSGKKGQVAGRSSSITVGSGEKPLVFD